MSESEDVIRLFRLLRNDQTLISKHGYVVGWGVEFPSTDGDEDGPVALVWKLDAFEEENRLSEPHTSLYGCFEDVKKATTLDVEMVEEVVM